MGERSIFIARMAAILVLHAAGAGLASPTVLVTRPQARIDKEWLPNDNQTLYTLKEGESKSLELNTTAISQTTVFITISPCTQDFHWTLLHGKTHGQGSLTMLRDYVGGEMRTFSIFTAFQDRYVIQLSTSQGGSAAISVRGEAIKLVRLRLRTRSRQRLVANWDPREGECIRSWVGWEYGNHLLRDTRIIIIELRKITDADPNMLHACQTYGGATHDSFIFDYSSVIRDHLKALTNAGIEVVLLCDSGYARRAYLRLLLIIVTEENTPVGLSSTIKNVLFQA